MKNYKILGALWWTPPHADGLGVATIGVVAIESYRRSDDEDDFDWKVYVGMGMGVDEDIDCERIARHGMPLGNEKAAQAFFPNIKGQYKY